MVTWKRSPLSFIRSCQITGTLNTGTMELQRRKLMSHAWMDGYPRRCGKASWPRGVDSRFLPWPTQSRACFHDRLWKWADLGHNVVIMGFNSITGPRVDRLTFARKQTAGKNIDYNKMVTQPHEWELRCLKDLLTLSISCSAAKGKAIILLIRTNIRNSKLMIWTSLGLQQPFWKKRLHQKSITSV